MGLFSTAQKDSQVGVDFLPDGVAVTQVDTGRKHPGRIVRSEFVEADGQEAQAEALKNWVHEHGLQKTACVCLVANDDCDVYQVERPEVEDTEMIQAVSWKIKDLINYDVAHAVVDSYPMPPSKNKQHQVVQSSEGQSLALLTLTGDSGLLSIYHDTDLYISREFMIGINQLGMATADDESVYESLMLELQRSLDYFESYYGMGMVSHLRIFPQLKATEKMAMYVQNLTNFDIEFIDFTGEGDEAGLDPHCFHAYCAALRGVTS